jgi:hypothetical protein
MPILYSGIVVEKPRTSSADKPPRGPSTPRYRAPLLCHRFAKRFAQDDGFVWSLQYGWLGMREH